MTVSKLAWPVSSGAAAFAASCLSELQVPLAEDRSMGIFNEICQENINRRNILSV